MTFARPMRIGLALVIGILGFAAGAAAQTNDEVFPQFQWNFSTPGARANGMGRTFIGMADDATATVTNPAGLVSLTKPQVYAEYKNTNISVDRLAAVDSFLAGHQNPTTFSTNVNALSFFNVSAPIGHGLAAGFTVHQFLNYQETFQLAARGIPDINNPSQIVKDSTGSSFATNPVDGHADFKGTSYAGTIAYAVNDQLRVGLTVSENHLSAESTGTRTGIIFGAAFPGDPTALGASPIIKNQTVISDSANAFGLALGVLYRQSENFSIGFDYTRSPKFHIDENFLQNPGFTANPCCGTQQTLVAFAGFPKSIAINTPDHFGVGVGVRVMPNLLIGVDVVRVNYSSLADDFTLVVSFDSPTLSPTMFTVDNVTEFHVGAEYNLMTGKNPVFLRGGLFTNPNHTVHYSATSTDNVENSNFNAVYNLLPRDTEVRGTVGAGVAIGPRFQVDIAYVIKKEFVASTAVRF